MRYELRRLAKPRTHRALQSKSRLGAAPIGRVGLYGSGQPWSGSDLAADDLPSSVQSPGGAHGLLAQSDLACSRNIAVRAPCHRVS